MILSHWTDLLDYHRCFLRFYRCQMVQHFYYVILFKPYLLLHLKLLLTLWLVGLLILHLFNICCLGIIFFVSWFLRLIVSSWLIKIKVRSLLMILAVFQASSPIICRILVPSFLLLIAVSIIFIVIWVLLWTFSVLCLIPIIDFLHSLFRLSIVSFVILFIASINCRICILVRIILGLSLHKGLLHSISLLLLLLGSLDLVLSAYLLLSLVLRLSIVIESIYSNFVVFILLMKILHHVIYSGSLFQKYVSHFQKHSI